MLTSWHSICTTYTCFSTSILFLHLCDPKYGRPFSPTAVSDLQAETPGSNQSLTMTPRSIREARQVLESGPGWQGCSCAGRAVQARLQLATGQAWVASIAGAP